VSQTPAPTAPIRKALIIGSGPIVIGQACEFDYSGTQGCKALREDGIEVVLVNSNPATIMTDPQFGDRTYIEPITPEVVESIIARERPDVIVPTLGGQTALNTAMTLARNGVLEKYNCRLIGAQEAAIDRAEDRQQFKQCMLEIGLDVPRSAVIRAVDGREESIRRAANESLDAASEIGFPVIIRPSFTLGGSGGGTAYNSEEFMEIALRGLNASPTHEIMVEESVLGWKEYELEVMRDTADNVVIICGAGANADRPRVPVHARRRAEDHPGHRRGHGRFEHSVCGKPGHGSADRDRDEPAGEPFLGPGQQGHRISHRQDRGAAGHGDPLGRAAERHYEKDTGML
jgi:carbamoylphosphate synthase large subunit